MKVFSRKANKKLIDDDLRKTFTQTIQWFNVHQTCSVYSFIALKFCDKAKTNLQRFQTIKTLRGAYTGKHFYSDSLQLNEKYFKDRSRQM